MVVITLAHPQEVTGKNNLATICCPCCCYRPFVLGAGPVALGDTVPVTDMLTDVIFFDDLAHIGEDGLGAGNGYPCPRFESIAEGVEVRVRADTRVFVSLPGTTEGVFHFEDAVALIGALLLQMIGFTDPRNSCANNQHIKIRLILNVCLLHDISPCPSVRVGYHLTQCFIHQRSLYLNLR